MCLKWHFAVRRSRCDPMADISSVHSASATGGVTSNDKNKVVSKPIESYNSLTQLAAWGLPAIQTVAVLVARLVDADELLGKYTNTLCD